MVYNFMLPNILLKMLTNDKVQALLATLLTLRRLQLTLARQAAGKFGLLTMKAAKLSDTTCPLIALFCTISRIIFFMTLSA